MVVLKAFFILIITSNLCCSKHDNTSIINMNQSVCERAIAVVSEERHAGKVITENKQKKLVNLNLFLDTALLRINENVLACNTKRLTDMCVVDSLTLFVYKNGVYIESGLSGTLYTLHDSFPVTPSGITPKMSKKQIVSILGKPEIESENRFQYATDDSYQNAVLMYFKGDQLYTIFYADRSGDCLE